MLKSFILQHKQLLARIIRFGIGIGLLVYVLLSIDLKSLFASIVHMQLWLLGVGVLLVSLSWTAMAFRWHILLRALDWQIRLVDTWVITQTSQFYSLFLPGQIGGEISRWVKVITKASQSGVDVAVSIVMDRLIGLSAQIMIGTFAIALYRGPVLSISLKLVIVGLALGNVAFWIIIMIGLDRILPDSIQNLLASLAERVDVLDKLLLAIWAYQGKGRAIIISTIVALVGHALSAFNKILIAIALRLTIPPLELILVYVIVSILVMIPITISGMGLREASYVGLLREFGHNEAAVAAVPLISFALLVFTALTLGGTLELFGGLHGVLKSETSSTETDISKNDSC